MQPAFLGEAARQLRIGQRIEQPDHATGMPAVLDQLDHRVGHAAFLAVEADDEAGGHEHAGVVDLVHALRDAAARVLLLLRLHERLGIGALDADEDADEIGLLHQPQQLVVVGEIERGLGGESNG